MIVRKSHVAYAATMFASSAINNLFVTYYLEVFVYVVNISPAWFYAGQTIFMLWNAVNDPLFGWLSDTLGVLPSRDARVQHPQARRLLIIQYGGLAWCMAFVLVWFAPSSQASSWLKGIHFTMALCLYDGALSLVEVNHSALLADMTTSSTERARFNAYAGVFAAVGSLSSLVGHALFHRSDLTAFRTFAFAVALVAFAAFTFTARTLSTSSLSDDAAAVEYGDDVGHDNGHHHHDIDANNNCEQHGVTRCPACTYTGPPVLASRTSIVRTTSAQIQSRAGSPSSSSTAPTPQPQHGTVKRASTKEGAKRPSALLVVRNLLSQRNFTVFMCVQFLQAFDCTFEKNHFSIFLVGLSDGAISPAWQSVIVSASFALPWVCTVLLTPCVQRHGVAAVVRCVFLVRLVVCVASASFSNGEALFCSTFLLVNRVLSECVCRLCPLLISDLIDEDRFLRQREQSLSATVVGASTFFGKFAQSLAPMMGFTVLRHTFADQPSAGSISETGLAVPWMVSSSETGGGDAYLSGSNSRPDISDRSVLNALLLGVPMVCVVLQYALWTQFTLHGSYLRRVKAYCNPILSGKLNP
jgi:Na+/melibiose symporter-like transporter